MSNALNPIPDDYPGLSPYLCVANAADAIRFYTQVFGANEAFRLTEPGTDRIGHAELRIGRNVIMLSDEFPEYGVHGPQGSGGSPVTMHIYVEDVDTVAARFVAAGGTALGALKDEFYGERCGRFVDPFGHHWHIASQIETVTPEEMQRRYDAIMAEYAGHEAPAQHAPAQPVPAVPSGFGTVTPYLVVPDVDAMIGFLASAFDARETFRAQGSGGGIHTEVKLGNSMVMIGQAGAGASGYAAQTFLYVDDVDAWYARAIAAGATAQMEPTDREDGHRMAFVGDPWGNAWYIGQQIAESRA